MKKSQGKTPAKPAPSLPDRLVEIDLLKGLAILAVILIHTWAVGIQLAIGAPFHIYHAVALLLLIAGFTGTYAYLRRGATTPGECYDTGLLIRRFSRLLKPYLLMFILQIVILFLLFRYPFDPMSVLVYFFSGGYGLGAYFVPVIFQSVIIVPVLYLAARKNPDLMLAGAFAVDLVIEFLAHAGLIPAELYGICYAKFLFAGALGVWLALAPRRFDLRTVALGTLSAVYIGILYYTQLLSGFFTVNVIAGISEAFAFVWTYVLALAGYLYLPKHSSHPIWRGIGEAGKASWHIFLVQMTFFSLWQPLNNAVLTPVYHLFPPALSFAGLMIMAAVTIAICAGAGWLWYRCESAWPAFRSTPAAKGR